MKNVIIYSRVSSDEQAEGTSLDYQERVLMAYCNNSRYNVIASKREDYTAQHHYLKRPEMKWIYEYCRKHKGAVDMVLFLRWDRFARCAEFAFKYIRKFNEMGITVNSIENTIDFSSPDWSTLIGVYCGSAQAENAKISKRTKEGIRETLKKGKCANKAPRGYKNVRISKHDTHVEIDENTAPLVRTLFYEVAKGVEAPMHIRGRIAKHIPKSTYFKMLRNVFYIGRIIVPKFNDEPQEIIKGVHEPLIPDEVFYKVQEILDGKTKSKPKLRKTVNPDLYLRNILRCPVCDTP